MEIWIYVVVGIMGWEIGKSIVSSFKKYDLLICNHTKFGYDETHYTVRKIFGFDIKKEVK